MLMFLPQLSLFLEVKATRSMSKNCHVVKLAFQTTD